MREEITDTELVNMQLDDDGSPTVTIEARGGDDNFTYVITSTVTDDLASRSREEVEATARKWFGIATDMKTIQDQLATDLEIALNAVRDYQRDRAESETPDPSFVAVRNLLTKYRMDYVPPAKTARVWVDGVDITEHPDSIEGSVDDIHLTGEQYYGIETVELVADEDGQMHMRQVSPAEMAPEADTLADEPDPVESIDPATRAWLEDEILPGQPISAAPHTPTPEELADVFREFGIEIHLALEDNELHKSPEEPAPISEEAKGMSLERARRVLELVGCSCDGYGVVPGPRGYAVECDRCHGDSVSNAEVKQARLVVQSVDD